MLLLIRKGKNKLIDGKALNNNFLKKTEVEFGNNERALELLENEEDFICSFRAIIDEI